MSTFEYVKPVGMPTLAAFIEAHLARNRWPKNAYVAEPGFEYLYVRMTERYIARPKKNDQKYYDKGIYYIPTLDIANLEATKKGEGTFKKLIERLRNDYPDLHIYVESVQPKQFREGLLRMGFTCVVDSDVAPCYFLARKSK